MNYVLFYPDELRAESMSVYGHPLIKTPNYERLAREGTVFEHNYSTHPVCAASRCSLVTGWYPHVKGYRTLRYELDNSQPNFFKYLREAGYKTCLSAKNHCFDRTATEAGFDRVIEFTRTSDMWQDVIQKRTSRLHDGSPAGTGGSGRNHSGSQICRGRHAVYSGHGRGEKPVFYVFFHKLPPLPLYRPRGILQYVRPRRYSPAS